MAGTDRQRRLRLAIGLGLAVAQSVAENHGGTFVLKNHPDRGAEALLALALKEGGQ